jgi:hypothetical protein
MSTAKKLSLRLPRAPLKLQVVRMTPKIKLWGNAEKDFLREYLQR